MSELDESDDDQPTPAEPEFSDDVHQLCDHLANWVIRNGNRKPTVGKRWLQSMDRLIRIDGYAPDQIAQVIEWSQQNEFWQGNILSADKLRKQFDQLKNQMFQDQRRTQQPRMTSASERALSTLQIGQQLQSQYEAQSSPRQLGTA